jgi:hypothetical protein
MANGLADENTDLVVVAQRSLDAEVPPEAQARLVLTAIGGQPAGTRRATPADIVLDAADLLSAWPR